MSHATLVETLLQSDEPSICWKVNVLGDNKVIVDAAIGL